MKLTSLHAYYVEDLRDLYGAVTQLMRALPKIAKLADSPQLREALTEQHHQCQAHVGRLEKMFDRLGLGPKGAACRVMEAMITEGKDLEGRSALPTVQDVAIIGGVLRAAYYLMAACVCTRDVAERLGETQAQGLLQAMLEENQAVQRRLSEVCAQIVRIEAA
jgi:ferritin-like metal-binding protein YciE